MSKSHSIGNRAPIKLPSADYLRECFTYAPDTGALTWKRRPRKHFANAKAWATVNARFVGQPAGCVCNNGYIHVALDGTLYLAHRLIWKLFTDEEPPESIDHANGDRTSHRWRNLRAATPSEQQWNKRLGKNNTSGQRGVALHYGKHQVRLNRNGTTGYYGRFDSIEEASAAARDARRKLHGQFYRD